MLRARASYLVLVSAFLNQACLHGRTAGHADVDGFGDMCPGIVYPGRGAVLREDDPLSRFSKVYGVTVVHH